MDLLEEIKKFGWEPWYNPNYFVNSSILPPELAKIDHTRFGVDAETAIIISTNEDERKQYIEGIKMFLGLSAMHNIAM